MQAVQQSLWDQPTQAVDEQGEIRLLPVTWADGDTRPEQLERLAAVKLGDLVGGIRQRGTTQPVALDYHLTPELYRLSQRPEIERVFYQIIATAVVGNEVLCACEYLCTGAEFYGGSNEPRVDEDDDEWEAA